MKQYAIYIGKAKLSLVDYVENEAWRYEYHLLDMREIDCGVLIERNTPESLVLAILCDFKDRPKQDVVNFIVKRLHDIFEDNEKEFQSYLKMLEIYSKNRDLKQAVKEAENMLTRYDETTLPSYELGWEAAERKYEKQVQEQRKELDETKLLFAQTLLREKKYSLEEVSSLTKLPLEQVKQLADKIANNDKQRH